MWSRYILVYPQGCDVCNHLSLFLCVADYDKLLPGASPGACNRPSQSASYRGPAHAIWLCDGPGWSHFSQFTIAVVNKDPKKSKYSGTTAGLLAAQSSLTDSVASPAGQAAYRCLNIDLLCACADTLHRFCKKEHDWGWKKFMELSKVLEGFTVSNTLVIKAQVQVIRYLLQ